MSWTRTQYIDETRALADAVGATTRWTPTTVNRYLGVVHAREWKRLLDANRYYRFATRTVTTASDGTVALTDLDSGTGDSKQWHYRVLGVSDGSRMFQEVDFSEMPLATTLGAANTRPRYYRAGTALQLLPVEAAAVRTIWVNWFPTPIDQLADDNSPVDFPANYELLLAHEAAALMLAGRETGVASDLQAIAQQLREKLLSEIARTSDQPLRMAYSDSKYDWGSA